MLTLDVCFRRHLSSLLVASLCLAGLSACEDDQAPRPLPEGIAVVEGNAQYTRKGTTVEEPVTARVTLEGGAPAAGVVVNFQVIEGGGSLSRGAATTNSSGRASVRWTVGPDVGNNRLRITVADNSNLAAIATATASEYYCVEEDPTFVQKFTPTDDLMMFTSASSHTPAGAGIARYDFIGAEFTSTPVGYYPDAAFKYVVRDCAFSANGDLFVSWNHIHDEIMKVSTNGTLSHFATLETHAFDVPPGAELAMTPNGVLVGCDAVGPFYVTCRDTLFRFEDAVFSGIDDASRDLVNNDALACHPVSGDVYFIYRQDRRLYKVPFDGTTAGLKAEVAVLDLEESDGARGMVVDGTDGSIYILVESATVKSIVKVTSGGVKTTVYDFFDRGAGAAAGVQSDLALDRGPVRYLYTLDTLNNTILRYAIAFDQLVEFTSDGDAFAASGSGSGERVGLDVIPGP